MSRVDREAIERVSMEVYDLLEANYVFPGRVSAVVEASKRRLREVTASAYALKNRGRATLVGETTRGAALGRILFRAEAHVAAHIPSGSLRDPLTGTSWEGIGVAPDIDVTSERALEHAHRLALQSVIERTARGSPPEAEICDEAKAALAGL